MKANAMKPKDVKSLSSSAKVSVVIERLEKTFGKKEAVNTTCCDTGYCRPGL